MNESAVRNSLINIALAIALTLIVTTSPYLLADEVSKQETIHHIDSSNSHVYITGVGLLLDNDHDMDGYFSRFTMTIQTDAKYGEGRVYAILDLVSSQPVGSPFYVTNDFSVYQHSLSNNYKIELDLVSNYPAELYNLRVSLYSTRNNRLLDTIGASDLSNLRDLPLESEDADILTANGVAINSGSDFSNSDVRVNEYAGSTGTLLILMIVSALAVRLLTQRQSA